MHSLILSSLFLNFQIQGGKMFANASMANVAVEWDYLKKKTVKTYIEGHTPDQRVEKHYSIYPAVRINNPYLKAYKNINGRLCWILIYA